MWEAINSFLTKVDDFVWGPPLMILIIAGGILLTIRMGVLQVRKLPLALKWMVKNEEEGEGEVTSFGALCTALSATIGTGNIVGVKAVNQDDEMMLITTEGIIIRIKVSDTALLGRVTSGVKLMNIDQESDIKVASIAKVRESATRDNEAEEEELEEAEDNTAETEENDTEE